MKNLLVAGVVIGLIYLIAQLNAFKIGKIKDVYCAPMGFALYDGVQWFYEYTTFEGLPQALHNNYGAKIPCTPREI